MKKFFSISFFLFIISSCSMFQSDPTKLTYKEYTPYTFSFDNGLRLIVYENHKLPIVSYWTYFDVGARFEEDKLYGGTHLLEHLMFLGAKKYGAGEMDKILSRSGGFTNAYTHNDATVYHNAFPSKMLEQVADIEADRMQNLLLEPKLFESERNVVLEEQRNGTENNPSRFHYKNSLNIVFEGTPYGHDTIGTQAQLKELTRENIQKYFKTFYAPNNAIIIVVGDVKVAEVYNLIKEKYSTIPLSQDVAKEKQNRDRQELYQFKKLTKSEYHWHANSENQQVGLFYRGVPIYDEKMYALDIFSDLLSLGSSSYLYQTFITSKNPFVSDISCAHQTLVKSGSFFVLAEMLPEKNAQEFKNELINGMKNYCNQGIDEKSLDKIKNMRLVSHYFSLQTNESMARTLAEGEAYIGNPLAYEIDMNKYAAVTVNEVKTACKWLLDNDEYIFTSVWNKNK